MNMKNHRIAPDLKEQIINRIKNEGVSVTQAAKDHGVSEPTIYAWIGAKTEGGPSVMEIAKLRRENDELLRMVGLLTLKLNEAQKKK
jgi:transposase-like protein